MNSHTSHNRVDVVIIGAGFAGLSAAVRLAAAGLKVAVLEQAPRLGGRASAFTDKATGQRVDNGQHVLFGCYRETYAFLRAIGAETLAPLQPRLSLPMIDASGRLAELRCPNLPPPWHLLSGLMTWRALSLADRIAVLRVGRMLRRAGARGFERIDSDVPPDLSVTEWLDRLGQSKAVRDWLWHPLTLAALNQSADTAAAAPFVRTAAQLFGPRVDDSAVGLASVPLDEMYAEPAVRYIEARGGTVSLRSPATIVMSADGRMRGVRTPERMFDAATVISSVPWHAFASIWEADPPAALDAIGHAAAAMESSPIVTVNLWLDGPVLNRPFVGLVDGPVHWVFDKAAIVGERAAHLAVVTSGADQLAAVDNAEATRVTIEALSRVLPQMSKRSVLRSVVVREQRATFSLRPGGPPRPRSETGLAGFYLAGDWTDTGLPATIEGAVVSGHRAAQLVLAANRSQRLG